MAALRSRYRTAGTPDYSHRFHAGNVGDVWKHCVLLEVLHHARASDGRVAYVETHAGEGSYSLAPTGEWTEGIGRLWELDVTNDRSPALARYLSLCRSLGAGDTRPTTYPGSPAFARAALGTDAMLTLYERDEQAGARLRAATGNGDGTRIVCADGIAALPQELLAAEHDSEVVVALIDPPYNEKADWITLPDALIEAARVSTKACLLLWYPVKSLTRPNAMIARFAAARVHGFVAELITTALTHQRRRLNGSGVILVRPPAGALQTIAAAAASVGPLCATHDGAWSFRMLAW